MAEYPLLPSHKYDETPPGDDDPAAFSFSRGDDLSVPELRECAINDLGNAECLAVMYGWELCHSPAFGWLGFDGQLWKGGHDNVATLRAAQIIKIRLAVLEQTPVEAGEKKEREQIRKRLTACGNRNGIRGMLDIASAILHVEEKEFDADPYQLNTPNGVVCLKTGAILNYDPERKFTRCAGVEYEPDAHSDLWEKTIFDIADGDPEVIAFLQKVAGYACTGDVSAQKFFYFFGQGANGKSLINDLWAEALGGFGDHGYVVRLNCETVLGSRERNAGSPSPDLWSLRGRRLALFTEQSGDSPINPERLKDLTGGDSITARLPHAQPVTFRPSHTLIGCGNHKPQIHSSDYAIWRRLQLIPFTRTFKPSRLGDQLRTPKVMRAILAWMVRGAVSIDHDGWGEPPAVVVKASRDFQTEADLLRQWKDQACEDCGEDTSTGLLFANYDRWCVKYQEPRISHSRFTRRMEKLGYIKRSSNGQSLLCGLRLKPASTIPNSSAIDISPQ